MRGLFAFLLISGMALGQAADAPKAADAAQSAAPAPGGPATAAAAHSSASQSSATQSAAQQSSEAHSAEAADPNAATSIIIPAGTKIPLSLAQAISTKNAREGDAVYATTSFPFVMNNRVIIPAGAYVQGKISHVERAGHGSGRAELLMHFTSIIYPSGYTVMLPGSVEKTPGADNNAVKDQEGTIQQDSDTNKKVEDAAQTGAYGGAIGGIGGAAAGGWSGARMGAGAGAAAGIAYALLKRGPDVKLDVGTSIEMDIQRPITVDAGRINLAKAGP